MSMKNTDAMFFADDLVAEAIAKTGFSDFGSLPYRDGLKALLQTYNDHVLDPVGRKRCRKRVVNLLSTRLRCEHAFKQILDLDAQTIIAPIFVTGLPRSGTSALLNMLASAPDNRALLQWETHFPDPWPGNKPGQQDPRYQPLADALAAQQNQAFNKIHQVTADTPEECVLLHSLAFSGVQLGFEVMLEPYSSWLKAQDLSSLYGYQLKLLKLLNWRQPGKRWMLKAPAHMWGINSILEVFPDARFIWCHRNPLQVIPSINSMNQTVMQMFAGDCSHIPPQVMGPAVMEWYAESLEQGLTQLQKLPQELFIDCSQQEFVDQPLLLAERLYQFFDLPFEPDTKAALTTHIAANPKGKYGLHHYDLSTYGLTEKSIQQRFTFYLNDSRWPISD